MPSNKQRRDAARRKLERQLQAREERARRRRRGNLIASIVGGLIVVGVVIAFIAVSSNNDKKSDAGSSSAASDTPTPTPSPTPSKSYPAAKGATVTFQGVTVTGAADLTGRPGLTSKSTATPTALAYKDLVVGKGAAATTASTVNVQYIGALYKTGSIFDESWKRGSPASFPLTGVVPGFSQGIAGKGTIPPMKVGGRRIIIIPSALGYAASAQTGIPANSTLVFVVDLLAVTATPTTAAS